MLDIALILLSALAVFGAYMLVTHLVLWCLRDVLTLGVRAEKGMTVEDVASLARAYHRARERLPVLLEEADPELEKALRAEGLCVYVRRP